jgi:hypothetical protein
MVVVRHLTVCVAEEGIPLHYSGEQFDEASTVDLVEVNA